MNLSEQIKQKFLYKPTKEQENLLKLLTNFLLSFCINQLKSKKIY